MRPTDLLTAAKEKIASASDSYVLLRGTAGSFGVKAISNGLLFAAQILFANYLGVDGFGIYVLALAWMNILLLASRQGFDLATVRYVAAYRAANDHAHLTGFLRASTTIVLIGSTVSSIGLVAYLTIAESALGRNLYLALMVVAGIVPLFALLQIKAAVMRGLGRVVLGDLPHAIIHPALLILLALLAVFLFDVAPSPAGALFAYLLSIGLSLIAVWMLMRRALPRSKTRAAYKWKEWALTAPSMTLIAGFGIILNQIGAIMLGWLGTTADAGFFGASSRVALMLQLVVFALISALAPMAARLHAANDRAGLQRAIGTTGRLVFLLCLVGAGVLAIAGEWVLGWFGSEFRSAYGVMMILLIGQLAWAANAPAGVILNMSGRHNASAILLGIAVAIDAILSIVLIPRMGAMGAAIANTATLVLWNIGTAVLTYQSLGIRSWVWLRDPQISPVSA